MKTLSLNEDLDATCLPQQGTGIFSYYGPLSTIKKDGAGESRHYPIEDINLDALNKLITGSTFEHSTKELRSITDKKKRNEFKKRKLLSVTPNAAFHYRGYSQVKELSNYFVADFDDVKNPSVLIERQKGDTVIRPVLSFISPSGNGIKSFYIIDPSLVENTESKQMQKIFYSLNNYLALRYADIIKPDSAGNFIDPSGQDVARLCYLCHDPQAYYNPHEESSIDEFFYQTYYDNPKEKNVNNLNLQRETLNDFENLKRDPDNAPEFIKRIERIETAEIDITQEYNDWLKIGFALANEFGEDGRKYFHRISEFNAEYNYSECDKQYTHCLKAENQKAFDSKKITIGTFFEIANTALEKFDLSKSDKKKKITQYSHVWCNNHKLGNVELSTGLLADLLIEKGYRRYNAGYILERNGVLKKVTKEQVYQAAISLAINQQVQFKVKNKEGITVIFLVDKHQQKTLAQKTLRGSVLQLAIPEFDKPIFRDSMTEVFFHFENGSVKVTSEGIFPISREGLCIWDTQVIKHDLLEHDFINDAVFYDFIKNISGNNCPAFCSAIGYLLRDCNGSDGLKAGWFYDSDFEAGKLKGRTGKSLVVKAIGQVRKLDLNSGKEHDHGDRFKFQTMDTDTQVCVLDDVTDKFYFDKLFNYCTEGVESQRKYADRVKLSVQETPKLIITSNYPPPLEQGASVIGRLIVLPVQPYYSPYAVLGGVKHIHGHTFFDDWDADEWNRFFWFMLHCVQQFLKCGLENPDQETTYRNRLKAICAVKIKDEDQADDLVTWLYEQPKEAYMKFRLEDLKAQWAGDDFNRLHDIDDQNFAYCLKSFFDLKAWPVKKTRERDSETKAQKRVWEVACAGV